MKTNELMLGDWVKNRLDYGTISAVLKYDRVIVHSGIWDTETSAQGIEPIPLTPEILEKNGFKYVNDEPFFVGWEQYGMVLDKRADGGFSVSILIATPIYYVHELQHVLRLCGIEKEIEL